MALCGSGETLGVEWGQKCGDMADGRDGDGERVACGAPTCGGFAGSVAGGGGYQRGAGNCEGPFGA